MGDHIGFVYVWRNSRTGKLYIGSHKGAEDDGYVGSGKYFKRAYKSEPENFERHILERVSGNIKYLREREAYWLQAVLVGGNSFYNLSISAGGGSNHDHLTEDERQEIYRRWRQGSALWLASLSSMEREVFAEKKRQSWKSQPDLVAKHSLSTRARRLKEEAEKTDAERDAFSQLCSDTYWSRSPDRIKDHRNAQSEGVKAWHAAMTEEARLQRSKRQKETKAAKKARQIHHPKLRIGRQVASCDLNLWLEKGWRLGMLPKRPV